MTSLPRIQGYRILRELGSGGMGRVYEALARLPYGATHPVAIKIPHPNYQSDQTHELFAREVQTAIDLNHRHPNLVTVYGGGETDAGQPYMVMELIDGTTVSQLCARQPLSAEVARRIARVLLEALQFLHAHGVVHRDVKPSNVLIDRKGHVSLSDFGLAKPLDSSQSGRFHGTPAYASPEQLRQVSLTPASDLFSLGVVLYRMLTGRRPFEASDIKSMLATMKRGTPTMPREVPLDLSRLVTGLLEPDIRERLTIDEALTLLSSSALPMASDEEIATRVAACLADLESDVQTIVEEKTESAPGAPILPADGEHPVDAPLPRSRIRWTPVLGLLAVALALVLGGHALWSASTTQTSSIPATDPHDPSTEPRIERSQPASPTDPALDGGEPEPEPIEGQPAVETTAPVLQAAPRRPSIRTGRRATSRLKPDTRRVHNGRIVQDVSLLPGASSR